MFRIAAGTVGSGIERPHGSLAWPDHPGGIPGCRIKTASDVFVYPSLLFRVLTKIIAPAQIAIVTMVPSRWL